MLHKKRVFLLTVLCLLLILSAIPVHAAGTNKNYTLKQGKWKTIGLNRGIAFNFIKVKVPKTGMITIYTKASRHIPEVSFFKKKPKRYTGATLGTNTNIKFRKNKVYKDTLYLKKGTYYFSAATLGYKFKIKYKFNKSVSINSNFSRKTSTMLPEGKLLKEWYSKDTRAGRWYKINLTKESVIWLMMDQVDCYILDESGNETYLNQEKSGSAWYHTNNKMKPGTYYIVTESFDKDMFYRENKYGIEPYLLFSSDIRWSANGPLK